MKILLADDHAIVRQGIVILLQAQPWVEIVWEAGNGSEVVQKARQLRPDVIVLDVHMPVQTGVEATRSIVRDLPDANIVMLTVSERDEDLFEAIRAGARGYVLKSADAEEFFRAIRAVAAGGGHVSPSLAVRLMRELSGSGRRGDAAGHGTAAALTPHERRVLREVARGKSNREIAEAMVLAEATVKAHLRSILQKLHLKNRVEAALYAAQHGLDRDLTTGG